SRSKAWSFPSPAPPPPALSFPPPTHTMASFVPSLVVMMGDECPPESPHHTSVTFDDASIWRANRSPPPIAHPDPPVQLLFATTYTLPPMRAHAAALLIAPSDTCCWSASLPPTPPMFA